jgi:methionyl-tRNA formyltransferase
VRILFAGSPEVALPSLDKVASWASELAVMSQPDRPVGRKRVLTPTPVSTWASDHGVTLFRPESAKELHDQVAEFSPDLAITVAFGRILTPNVLAVPTHGWWNLHFSLLPRFRGAAPVQHALFEGDTKTGVTVFQIDEGLDTGPILGALAHPITPGITTGELLGELSHLGATLVGTLLEDLAQGSLRPTPQSGVATHAPKPDRDMGHIRAGDSLEKATRRFQATTPEPGCFVSDGAGRDTLRILAATTQPGPISHPPGTVAAIDGGVGLALNGGYLLLHEVHPAGKKPMRAVDWWRGVTDKVTIDG